MSEPIELARRAVARAIRDKECPDGSPLCVLWRQEILWTPNPARAAIELPELFAEFLRSGRANDDAWASRKLLPKRLRGTLPAQNPSVKKGEPT